jgi:hypothetical protein
MSTFSNAQWPFVPTETRPLFFLPRPDTQKAPAWSEPWVYADRQARKRRRSEVDRSDKKTPKPDSSQPDQQRATYASYLASQAHLSHKVRIAPTLLVSQILRHFRVSDKGDHIVAWASQRLTPIAWYLALPWNYLQCLIQVRHQRLAQESEEEEYCQHVDKENRVGVRVVRSLDKLLKSFAKFMYGYHKRRQPKANDESEVAFDDESNEYEVSDVDMEDTPSPLPPRQNYDFTVKDAESNDIADLDDDEDDATEKSTRNLDNSEVEKKKILTDQPTRSTKSPPSNQQNERHKSNFDNGVRCPRCTYINQPFMLLCEMCNIPFTRLFSRARAPRSQAKEYVDWDLCNDGDDLVMYKPRHKTLRDPFSEMTGRAGPEGTLDRDGNPIPIPEEEVKRLLRLREAEIIAHTKSTPDECKTNQPYYDDDIDLNDIEKKERTGLLEWGKQKASKREKKEGAA